ncbi:hypothetical protein [Myroides odoratus]|uniref:hypothetical protein n=1 Tax=Myroides odoratus TaxID=256 RepID=UPI0039B054CD
MSLSFSSFAKYTSSCKIRSSLKIFLITCYSVNFLSDNPTKVVQIAGGDFWKGMRQGLIVSGLNHAMHMGVDELEQEGAKKKTYNEKTPEERDYSYIKETLLPASEFTIEAAMFLEGAKGLWGLATVMKNGRKSLGMSSSLSSKVDFTVNPGKFDYFFGKNCNRKRA